MYRIFNKCKAFETKLIVSKDPKILNLKKNII